MKRIWFHFLRSRRFHHKTKVLWFHCAKGTISFNGYRSNLLVCCRAGACSRREISKIWLKPNGYAKIVGVGDRGGSEWRHSASSEPPSDRAAARPSTTRLILIKMNWYIVGEILNYMRNCKIYGFGIRVGRDVPDAPWDIANLINNKWDIIPFCFAI